MNTYRHEIRECGRRIQCRNCIILHAFGHADTPSKVSPVLSTSTAHLSLSWVTGSS